MPPKSHEDGLTTATPAPDVRIQKDPPAEKDADPSETTKTPLPQASLTARYTCASIVVAIFAVWGKLTFVSEGVPGGTIPLHSWTVPLLFNAFYLVSLPLLHMFTDRVLSKTVDVKSLLKESMLVYNVGQVVLNGWMVYAFVEAVAFNGHPFIGGGKNTVETGATFAVWVHYCDKYLEFLDTYFMVLRGRMDQVSFLHVYHHTSISFAWWIGLKIYPGGDSYFGALFNSFIHVLMYSYYAMALMKISCPWKKYLTQAQLLQFASVVSFSLVGICLPSGTKTREAYIAHFVQDFEMISLFVLFMAFYRKTYTKKSRKVNNDDQTKLSASKTVNEPPSTTSSVSGEDTASESSTEEAQR